MITYVIYFNKLLFKKEDDLHLLTATAFDDERVWCDGISASVTLDGQSPLINHQDDFYQ